MMSAIRTHFIIRPTRLGRLGLIWSNYQKNLRVDRVILPHPERSVDQIIAAQYFGADPESCEKIDQIAGQISAALEGENILFSLEMIRLDLCPPFQQQVLRTEHRVPRGYVTTYQRIAGHLGKPKAARAVGRALATNPFPIIIPCHRAIRSDMTLGGYQGGLKMKQILLEQEGLDFVSGMRVKNPNVFY